MRKFKILILLAASIAAILVVCLTVYLVFSSLANRRQLKAFNDTDLIPVRLEVPVASNAFWTLLKATNELYWPESFGRKLDDLSKDTNWDDSLAADVLKKNRRCLDLFNEAMRQPFLVVPEPKTFAEDYSYLADWRTIVRVESIRTFALFREKDEPEAFDSAFEIIQFGQRAENSGGTMIHYLVGSAIKATGLRCIRQMIPETTLPETNLLWSLRELNRFKANQEGLTNTFKVEYQTASRFLDNLASGKNPVTGSESNPMPVAFSVKLFFSPTKTKMKFARADRVLCDNLSRPFSEIPWSELPVVETNVPVWKRIIKGNAVGDILFELMEPSLKSFASRKSRENVEVTATQLLLALKIYKMRHDQLPESLSDLAPEFFPTVPIDDFDGKPFRYLPDKKLIYSVGPDLKDSGGKAFQKNSEGYDLSFKIEF